MALQEFAWGSPRLKSRQSCWNKTNYFYQTQIHNDNIEQSQIEQACTYLAITVILQLGATLQVWINIHFDFRDLSQMESIRVLKIQHYVDTTNSLRLNPTFLNRWPHTGWVREAQDGERPSEYWKVAALLLFTMLAHHLMYGPMYHGHNKNKEMANLNKTGMDRFQDCCKA